MTAKTIRQFPSDTFSVRNEDGDAHLVALDEHAVYGVELGLPEGDELDYRVEVVRHTRGAYGLDSAQRLTVETYPSQMEAEEHLGELNDALYKEGRAAIEAHLPDLHRQTRTPIDDVPAMRLLDQRAELAPTWGWQESRLDVLPHADGYQVALLDVYHDALSGDVGGRYLSLGAYDALAQAEAERDSLLHSVFERDGEVADLGRDAAPRAWQPLTDYAVLEPPAADLDPLLAEALRLGATLQLEKEPSMPNTIQAERKPWVTTLHEAVTHQAPHVTAAYQQPENAPSDAAPVRLRPAADDGPYSFAVSAPDGDGTVTLAATKTFESEILRKDVTESAVLKTYRRADYAESYPTPRTDALNDARALVYEWGRHDLDHAMGSALLLAQENGLQGDQLFEQGPEETFAPVDDARPLAAIHAEREWEQAVTRFGVNGYQVPLPEGTTHARELGRFGQDVGVAAGEFYGIGVRVDEVDDAEPVYVVESFKATLDRDTRQAALDATVLATTPDQETALETANAIAQLPDFDARMAAVQETVHDFARSDSTLIEHQLRLATVPVQSEAGDALGHALVAFDSAWEHDETQITAYELAHFASADDATEYAASLTEYMDKRNLPHAGADINPTLEFVQAVREANGLPDAAHTLNKVEIDQLSAGQWQLAHNAADFAPMAEPETPQPEIQF